MSELTPMTSTRKSLCAIAFMASLVGAALWISPVQRSLAAEPSAETDAGMIGNRRRAGTRMAGERRVPTLGAQDRAGPIADDRVTGGGDGGEADRAGGELGRTAVRANYARTEIGDYGIVGSGSIKETRRTGVWVGRGAGEIADGCMIGSREAAERGAARIAEAGAILDCRAACPRPE